MENHVLMILLLYTDVCVDTNMGYLITFSDLVHIMAVYIILSPLLYSCAFTLVMTPLLLLGYCLRSLLHAADNVPPYKRFGSSRLTGWMIRIEG